MRITLKEFEYRTLCALLAYMPFHYYICELLIKSTSIDNILRDLVIGVLFVFSLWKTRRTRHGVIVALGICILCFSALFSYILNSYTGTFNILRTYVVPILIFYIISKMDLTEKQFVTIHRIVYFELALIGLYGFFQAFILGDDFLIKLGYSSNGGFLASTSYYIAGFHGYQRVVGTFVSPNIAGVIFAFGLAVLLFNNRIQEKKKRLMVFGLALGLIGTFSRSAILAFLVACFFRWAIDGKKKRIKTRMVTITIAATVAGVFAVYLIDKLVLDHLLSRMLYSSVSGILKATDPSANQHLKDLYLPLETVLKNPFGLGFGNNGPMAISYSNTAISFESSVYLMCYEVGIVGAVICFAPYCAVIVDTIRNRKYKYFSPACASVICMITYLLLPNIQTYEIIFYFYLMMGLYYNRSVRKIFDEKFTGVIYE